MEDGVDDTLRPLLAEGRPAGHRFVERRAQAPQVGARPGLRTLDLLRAHVGHGPEDAALAGEPRRPGDRRQAEIGELGIAVRAEQDVVALDVAVNDALGVRRGQGARDLKRDVDRLIQRQRPRGHPLAQALSVHQLQAEEDFALLLADFVDRSDVGMIEQRRGPRLAQEARPHLRVPDQLGREEF